MSYSTAILTVLRRPTVIVVGVALLFLTVIYFTYQPQRGQGLYEFIFPHKLGGITGLGYDGMFTYYIASIPLEGVEIMRVRHDDVPAYRYQRVLHGALTRIFTLGYEPLIPLMMILIALSGLAAGTWGMEQLLTDLGVSRGYALAYGLFAGVLGSVRLTTTEPLAFGLMILAILACQRERPRLGVLLFGLAALTKEPTLISAGAYVVYYLSQRRWGAAVRLAVGAGLPFVLWQLTLYAWIGSFGVGSGGGGNTPFEIIPFMALIRLWEIHPQIFFVLGGFAFIGAGLPCLFALYHTGRNLLAGRYHSYTFLLFFNALIIPFTPRSTFAEPVGIIRFVVPLVVSYILYFASQPTPLARRPLRYAPFWALWGTVMLLA
jgi:hypothetical protein